MGKGNTLTFTVSGNSTKGTSSSIHQTVPVADYPSNNLNYDYITGTLSMSGPKITGATSWFYFTNSTGVNTHFPNEKIAPGQNIYFSLPISDLAMGLNTTTGKGYSASILINIGINTPVGATETDTWKTTVSGLAFTDYAIPLGTNSTGSPVVNAIDPTMSTFGSAALTYSKVINNGYTVSVSQPLQNVTVSQTNINDGIFIEEATYQGTFELPTAPDLTYANSYISMNMTTPGSQYEVANLNGISYLTTLQTKNNGSYTFTAVNPNTPNTLILEEKFTASQWNASTNAPSIFSLAGIEYYWWVGLIGLMSIIGLGAAASSHFSGDEENLKIPKGKFGR